MIAGSRRPLRYNHEKLGMNMSRQILLLQGPNLNLLGKREPHIYGYQTLADILAAAEERFAPRGVSLRQTQSNYEGGLVEALHDADSWADGVVMNPAAYSHTSIALRDAIKGIAIPVYEVHISNIHARESFRHVSMVAPVCVGAIFGCGWRGYLLAIEALLSYLDDSAE